MDVAWIASVRPLVEQGALLFSAGADVEESGAIVLDAINERIFESTLGIGSKARDYWRINVARSALPIAMQLEAARLDRGTPIALNRFEDGFLRLLLEGYPLADRRVSAMSTLARLELPAFDSDPALAISVRGSDAFSDFRSALQSSLLLVEQMPAGEWGRATDIVGREMKGALGRLEKAARSSPALAAVQTGVRGLTFMGVGADHRRSRHRQRGGRTRRRRQFEGCGGRGGLLRCRACATGGECHLERGHLVSFGLSPEPFRARAHRPSSILGFGIVLAAQLRTPQSFGCFWHWTADRSSRTIMPRRFAKTFDHRYGDPEHSA